MLIILVIIILIFGASRLPEIGKGIGQGIKNFKGSIKDEDEADSETIAIRSASRARPASSPTRRVTRSRSSHSSSGIANFRVTP